MSVLDKVKQATWGLHTQAERTGVVAAIISGLATQQQIALYWRNLLPVYQALEAANRVPPELARVDALTTDLEVLAPGQRLPVLPAAEAYASRIRAAGPAGQVAHAYVRYLGDLNGGRIMRRRLDACLGDMAGSLRFHDFPAISDLRDYATEYRAWLDRQVADMPAEHVVDEAMQAFRLNIALAEDVLR